MVTFVLPDQVSSRHENVGRVFVSPLSTRILTCAINHSSRRSVRAPQGQLLEAR